MLLLKLIRPQSNGSLAQFHENLLPTWEVFLLNFSEAVFQALLLIAFVESASVKVGSYLRNVAI